MEEERNAEVDKDEMLFLGERRLLVPRYLFYTIFYACVLIGTLILYPLTFGPLSILLFSVLIFGIGTSLFELRRAWRIGNLE